MNLAAPAKCPLRKATLYRSNLLMTDPISASPLDLAEPDSPAGPRKLVRPRLPEPAPGARKQARRQPAPLLTHQDPGIANHQHGNQAELFYFQKQMQAQTPMVFILDDGERIEGVIEWCDLHVIKVRHITRTMIYKSSIKYLYKASDAAPRGVMTTSGS